MSASGLTLSKAFLISLKRMKPEMCCSWHTSMYARVIWSGTSVDVPGRTEKFCPLSILGCCMKIWSSLCLYIISWILNPFSSSDMGRVLMRSPPHSSVFGIGLMMLVARVAGVKHPL